MKSRIQRKNVLKSIRRSHRMIGGGKTYKFHFWITTDRDKYLKAKSAYEGTAIIDIDIIVKKPKKKTFFSKERKEYLFDVKLTSSPHMERFERFNKNNLTSDELILLFSDNYNPNDNIEVEFISNLFKTLRRFFVFRDRLWLEPDKIYLEALILLKDGLQQRFYPNWVEPYVLRY
jgi:hypothetical protein